MQTTPWPIFPGSTLRKIVLPPSSGNAGALHKFVRARGRGPRIPAISREIEWATRPRLPLVAPARSVCFLSPHSVRALPLEGGGLGWGSPALAALLYVTIIPPPLLSSHAASAPDSGHPSQQTPRAVLCSAESMIPKKHAPDLIRGGYRFSEKIMLQ